MCFLTFAKLICALIYVIVLFGIVIELALPHWRLYVNENGDAQLQTGIVGQCGLFGQTILKFNDSVDLIGTKVCEKWNLVSIFLLGGLRFWINLVIEDNA
uniref:Uncharacterized protein n=1 Tax=Panagrolaimus sp. ES5 TaxID=591445 RepID=A0AC34FKK8_9BILA